jgi:hypothetical protein
MYLTANPASAVTPSSGVAPSITASQQGVTLLNASVTPAANTAATITLTGAAGQRVTIRGIYIKSVGAVSTSTVIVQDGATTVLDFGTVSVPLAGATVPFTGNPLVTGTTGNSMTVTVGAGGALSILTVSVVADRQ